MITNLKENLRTFALFVALEASYRSSKIWLNVVVNLRKVSVLISEIFFRKGT